MGCGAYMPNGEMSKMIMSFDDRQIALMQAQKLSSVLPETKNVRLAVQSVVYNIDPVGLSGAIVVLTGDCQPSIQGFLKMGGTPDVFPEIKRLCLFAAHHDVHVDFIWKPRESPEMLIADGLSREEDSSEIFVTRKTFHRIVFHRQGVVHGGMPTLDVFAGAAIGQHKAARFYTKYCSPASVGISAMHCDWAADAAVHGHSLLWVFPPFHLIGAVISKLLHEQVNAILIVPHFLRYWSAMIQQLPVVDIVQLHYHAGLYEMGSRAPKNMQRRNKPRISLTAYLVQFPTPL